MCIPQMVMMMSSLAARWLAGGEWALASWSGSREDVEFDNKNIALLVAICLKCKKPRRNSPNTSDCFSVC